jgi:hypothetical protein
MASRHSRDPDPEKRADELLAGRQRCTARELIESIHAINPTGRGLASRDERRRYALKSRLQSLLIRTFGETLTIRRDERDPRVVTLAESSVGRDACHAVIADLDDDARAWVQFRLDAGIDDDEQ